MSIKYTVQNLENAAGSGESRPFIRLHQGTAMNTEQLAQKIADSSTLTPGDVKAVMAELSHYAKESLKNGDRFYLPEIGYLSLSVGNTPPELLPHGVITGKDIYVRNIDFKPEAQFLREVKHGVNFEKSNYDSKSVSYTEDELWQKLASFLTEHHYITRRILSIEFGLSKYKASQWLSRFTEQGLLKKESTAHQPIYLLATE